MFLFFGIFIGVGYLLVIVRKLWPPKEPEFELPKGCNSIEDYMEVCYLWSQLTEKQKEECMEWASGGKKKKDYSIL